MKFSNLKGWSAPKGNVTKLAINGVTVWKKSSERECEVGDTVYINVNGVRTPFIVIHIGQPSTDYNSSCNGVWLMFKDIYAKSAWSADNRDYSVSIAGNYVNTTLLNLIDSNIRSAIKQVRIPYVTGTASWEYEICTGSRGLSCKLFLLSCYEMGWTNNNYSTLLSDGACLDYFRDAADTDEKRIAYYNGEADFWWSRSVLSNTSNYTQCVLKDGGLSYTRCTNEIGVRPAFILPSPLKVDGSNNVIV